MKPFVIVFVVILFASMTHADIGDPTLRTDHPHYPGEGAFQTVDDCVAFATRGVQGEQDKAIALFNWLLTHQFHLMSPQDCRVPGVSPDTRKSQYDNIVEDANRGRFSYAYGLCGTVHMWNETYWRALGMQARRRAFPGHVNSEVFYGNAWHAFDTDMAGLVFRKDGIVAGYADIIADPSLATNRKSDIVCYPFAWPSDFNSMKKGWEQVAKQGDDKWWKLYHSGYAAHPGIVHLRSGEIFTRYFNRDHFGGPSKRIFWHVQNGGPSRNWTFVNMGTPRHEGGESNSRGNASYCNAVFEWEPAPENWNAIRNEDGHIAYIFEHFSPYVIAGDPVDDENPMTNKATDGVVVKGEAAGYVRLKLSVDQGQSWKKVAEVVGDGGVFSFDLTEHVKGRYGWMIRASSVGEPALQKIRFTTACQMAQPMYPRLSENGSKVIYRAASRGVRPVLPNWSLTETELVKHGVINKQHTSANVKHAPRGPRQRTAYTTTNNKPGLIAFNVETPGNLLEVRAASRFRLRVPSPKGCDFHLSMSTDNGKTWKKIAEAPIPNDNEYSSGWVYGKADMSSERMTKAIVRANVYAGGYTTGLIDADLYGVYRTAKPQAARIIYGWKEGGELKTHSEDVHAGKAEHVFTVPTGKNIVDEFVRIEAK